MTAAEPTIKPAGSGALLLDGARGPFTADVQRRVWAVGRAIRNVGGVQDAVPGMNNLLVVFDALAVEAGRVEEKLLALWRDVDPGDIVGKTVEIPTLYGGAHGEDLADWAAGCGLGIEDAVRRHAAAAYSVAAIGAMPGFPYLSGLDPGLARPRRASPRSAVPEGSVIIGGSQAGIMPQTAPSGWHILGRTEIKLFDPWCDPPALLAPGDTVRFSIAGIDP